MDALQLLMYGRVGCAGRLHHPALHQDALDPFYQRELGERHRDQEEEVQRR
jgi:hypothetical protein